MKVLLVGPIKFETNQNSIYLSNSGLSYCVWGWARGLADNGNKVAILPSINQKIDQKKINFKNVQLIDNPLESRLSDLLYINKCIVNIKRDFGTPDLIQIHDIYLPFNIYLARRFSVMGWPYIVTPSGAFSPIAQNRSNLKKKIANTFLINQFIKKSKAIHTLSINEELYTGKLFPKVKKITIGNGINVEDNVFNSNSKKKYIKGTGSDEIIFGFLGRINIKIKGIDLMLRAINIIADEIKYSKVKFVFIGPMIKKMNNDEALTEMQSLIRESKVKDKIIFSGPIYGEQKWRVLKSFNVFFQTSRTEGMPIGVLESMAMGKPCLVTEGSSMGQIIEESNSGWVAKTNAESIATLINKIVKTPKADIKNKGKNAKKFVLKNHDWKFLANRLIDNIKRI